MKEIITIPTQMNVSSFLNNIRILFCQSNHCVKKFIDLWGEISDC